MDIVEKLKKVGFTPAQSQIYIELLKNPGLNGTQLSKIVDLPRTTIYQSLDALYERGIVTLIPTQSDKKNYIPVEPRGIVENIKKEYKEILETIGIELEMLYKPSSFYEVYNINGKANVIYKMQDIIENAIENIVVVGLDNLELLPKTEANIVIEDSKDEFIILIDNKEILIGNINENYANAIYTKNMYVVGQYIKRREAQDRG